MITRPTLVLAVAAAAAVPAGAQVISLDEVVVTRASVEIGAPRTGSGTDAETAAAAGPAGAPGDPDAAQEAALRAPAPVSVVSREDIALTGQSNISDALQGVPGVIVPTSADDPALSVNIRGLQDFDRVIVSVDGARQNFSRSGHAGASSFYVDGDMIKAINVTRGPSSVVGGGAVGGTVEFVTIDADDVLRGDETVAARARTSLMTNGAGAGVHGEVAARISEAFDVLVAATAEGTGDYRTGDHQRIRSADRLYSGLFKARARIAEGHETTLSALRVANTFDNGISTVRKTESIADTVSLKHTYSGVNPLVDLTARAYYTATDLRQKDILDEGFGRRRSFDVSTVGGELYNVATFDAFGATNTTTVGGDAFRDHVETVDDAGLAGNATPPGNREVYGAYVQHSIERGWLEVIGALRFDAYHLSGVVEETGEAVDKNGSAVTPKITAAVSPVEGLTFYASYSEAYRPPSLTETLIQGEHPPPATFPFIPNPNLDPERAHNIEAGVNLAFNDLAFADDRLRLKASAFHNRVSDYIDLDCFNFPLPGGCTYVNIDEAVLKGVELEANYDMGRFYGILTGTFIESEDTENGEPLTNVPPSRVSGTVGMRAFAGKLDMGTTLHLVADAADADFFNLSGAGYGLLDAYASYSFDEDTSLTLTLNNIFDREYTQYLDLQPSPGFAARLTFERRFGARPSFGNSERAAL